MELILMRDWGLGHKLAAVWEGDTHIGQIEYRETLGKITTVYALGVRAEMRGRNYGRRIMQEIVGNPKAKILNIEPQAKGFWEKVAFNTAEVK